MIEGWVVIAVALGYISLLFVIASYGDRTRRFGREIRAGLLIYPLSLAIYCTSWTFFGSVGLASRTSFDFLTIYVGPIVMIGLCAPLIMRIVRLAKTQNITSIADFIAARYGKAQTVAAAVARSLGVAAGRGRALRAPDQKRPRSEDRERCGAPTTEKRERAQNKGDHRRSRFPARCAGRGHRSRGR